MKKVLLIGGIDPSSAAGITADLKVVHALGAYGLIIPSCLTIQNTSKVYSIKSVDVDFFMKQASFLIEDIDVDAVKIGLIGSIEILHAIIYIIEEFKLKNIVVDPVLLSSSQYDFYKNKDYDDFFKLFEYSNIITPNILEAEKLLKISISTIDDMKRACLEFYKKGAKGCILKGGHIEGKYAVDVYFDGTDFLILKTEKKVDSNKIHGTGCAFSTMLACNLAFGYSAKKSFILAKKIMNRSINTTIKIGKGMSVLNINEL